MEERLQQLGRLRFRCHTHWTLKWVHPIQNSWADQLLKIVYGWLKKSLAKRKAD